MRRPAAVSKAVLITGCSSGIGKATALQLARSGQWKVWATARRRESIAELEQAGCRTLALDVTDETSMKDAVAAIERDDGAISALVNNAGYQQTSAVESVAIDDMRRQFETNVFGPMRLIQLVAPAMRRQGWGRIVNMSSMGGRMTLPGGGVYHGSKHALEAMSDALRFELGGFGIDMIVVEPGLIRTDFAAAALRTIDGRQEKEGPYAKFNASIRPAYDGLESGPISRIVSGADAVARTVERALTADRPRTRYKVSPSAHIFIGVRRLTSDRMWDRIMTSMIARPVPS